MIIEGGSRSNSTFFGRHLSDTRRLNEEAEAVYAEGVPLGTPKEMLAAFEFLASGSKVKNFFTHLAFNNKGDRSLNPLEEIQAYKLAAKQQGLEGQPFFIVRHTEPTGEQHFHTITLRVDEDGKAVNNDFRDQLKMAESSREIEKLFGLRLMENVRKRNPSAKNTKKWERYKGAETGYTVKRVARDLKEIKAKAAKQDGQAFAEALNNSRYVLARGTTAPFVIIDRAGSAHSLGARLSMKPHALKKFMANVDLTALPTIKEAREEQRDEQKEENKGVISTLWEKHSTPSALIDALSKNGFIVANGDKRGVFMCVDRNGYYVSLERAAGVKKQEFFDRMKGADTAALPSLDQAMETRKAERKAWSEKHKNDFKAASGILQRIIKRLTKGRKKHGKFSTGKLASDYLRLCKNPLSNLRGWMDAEKRGWKGDHNLSAQSGANLEGNDGLRPIRATGGSRDTGGLTSRDPLASGRAQAAFESVFAKYAAEIEAVEKDRSLSPDQRAAAIAALRQRQHHEASMARQRVLEEEQQNTKARRRNYRALLDNPKRT